MEPLDEQLKRLVQKFITDNDMSPEQFTDVFCWDCQEYFDFGDWTRCPGCDNWVKDTDDDGYCPDCHEDDEDDEDDFDDDDSPYQHPTLSHRPDNTRGYRPSYEAARVQTVTTSEEADRIAADEFAKFEYEQHKNSGSTSGGFNPNNTL